MLLQTILNKVRKFKDYVHENVAMCEDRRSLHVHMRPREGCCPTCSDCGRKGPVYDRLPKARQFEFVPLWQSAVFFVDVVRRVDCCNRKRIVVEQIPWSDGKHHTTLTYRWFSGGVGAAIELIRNGGCISHIMANSLPQCSISGRFTALPGIQLSGVGVIVP